MQWDTENIVIVILHLKINKILSLSNPYGVDMPLNKANQTKAIIAYTYCMLLPYFIPWSYTHRRFNRFLKNEYLQKKATILGKSRKYHYQGTHPNIPRSVHLLTSQLEQDKVGHLSLSRNSRTHKEIILGHKKYR